MLLHAATRGHDSLTPPSAFQAPDRIDAGMYTAGACKPVRRDIKPFEFRNDAAFRPSKWENCRQALTKR